MLEGVELLEPSASRPPHPYIIHRDSEEALSKMRVPESGTRSSLAEDHPHPIPPRIWERLSRPASERPEVQ